MLHAFPLPFEQSTCFFESGLSDAIRFTYFFQMRDCSLRVMLYFEIVLRNFEIGLVITQPYGLLKPLQSPSIFLFISPHDSNIVSGAGLAPAIRTLVPIHRCRTVSSNACAPCIKVTQVYLARVVSDSAPPQAMTRTMGKLGTMQLLFAPPERVHQAERRSQVRLPLDRHV